MKRPARGSSAAPRRIPPVSMFAIAALALTLCWHAPFAGAATNDRLTRNDRVTRDDRAGSYVRHDGRSDAVTRACSTGRRQQNEPTVAISPRDPRIIVAGSNDHCGWASSPENALVWAGYYRSVDGGASWRNSLVPGYPGDESSAGQASPAHGCMVAADPSQAFDAGGRLFYAFICSPSSRFTPSFTISVYVATYDRDGGRYVRTVKVGEKDVAGTSAGLFADDKENIAVDLESGTVYVAWTRFVAPGAGGAEASLVGTLLQVSRSIDHGRTFEPPVTIPPPIGVLPPTAAGVLPPSHFVDLAVGPDGSVYLAFKTISLEPPIPGNAIWLAKSSDGGRSFAPPRLVAEIDPFDSWRFSGDPLGPNNCGDGPFRCPSGLTFARFDSQPAVAADERGVHVLWNSRLPGGQSKLLVRNSPDGLRWPTPPRPLDQVHRGHQWNPDLASANGVLSAVFYDSRGDRGYAPDLPPGNTRGGRNSGGAADLMAAQSRDGGETWSAWRLTTVASNPNFETFNEARRPFFGDYNYVSAVRGGAYAVWTDSRDLVPGSDPRVGADDDGFDVFAPCIWQPNDIDAESYSAPEANDPCLSRGGLDQNIYGAPVRTPR